jgi:uncharacterized membrane protein YidH (DUF202 family)
MPKEPKARKNKNKRKVGLGEEQMLLVKEQVVLSKERTVLSFMRTGIAAIGAGVVLINVFPGNHTSLIIGWALILIGAIEILESYRRLRYYREKMLKIKKRLGDEWI